MWLVLIWQAIVVGFGWFRETLSGQVKKMRVGDPDAGTSLRMLLEKRLAWEKVGLLVDVRNMEEERQIEKEKWEDEVRIRREKREEERVIEREKRDEEWNMRREKREEEMEVRRGKGGDGGKKSEGRRWR